VCYPATLFNLTNKASPVLQALQGSDQSEMEGLPRLLTRCVMRCIVDRRADLLKGMVVTGGVSAVQGMPERLQYEVETLVQPGAPHWDVKTGFLESSRRGITNWIGGSLLASLPAFGDQWVTKADYDEHGVERIYEQCP
jgi:actin-like protein 6A